MKTLLSFLIILLAIGCAEQNSDKEYYTLKEAFKNPEKVKKLRLGYSRFRSGTDRYFTLDSTIQYLVNLEELSITCNHIEKLPVEITKLKRLKRVTIVDEDNMSAPRNNCSLDLADTFKKLSDIESLETLYLPYIHSELPPEVGELTNIKNLQIVHNGLRTLPPEISKLKELKSLYIAYNDLDSLPSSIIELDSLVSLTLHTNHFKEIPAEIFELDNLRELDFGNNAITTIPEDIADLKNLKYLDLRHNDFVEFPMEILQLTNLETLDISRNKLFGIPSEISSFSALKRLDLSDDSITILPETFSKLDVLEELDLSENSIEVVPDVFQKMKKLSIIDLSNNSISELPISLFNLPELEGLNLNSNLISKFPDGDLNLMSLKTLDLNDNSITKIPVSLFKSDSLENLFLSFNNISEVPVELFELNNLEELTLFGNPISVDQILKQINKKYPWFPLVKLMFYVIPFLCGFGAIFIAIRLKNKVSLEETVYYCSLMSFINLVICSFCSWRLPFLWYDFFNAEYLYPRLFINQWTTIWIPIIVAVLTSVILMGISIKGYLISKKEEVIVSTIK